jgi:RNA polymerase sigma-70 factor (ECF subfamily)
MQTATTEDDEELPVPGWLVDTVTCNPQTALERAEQRRLLDELVNSLPKGKRDVVRLIHEEELDSREVARLLAIPEGTVRSRLHHARKSLAQLWEAHTPDTD